MTLLKIMMGLIPPTTGEVKINGISIYPKNIKNYRNWIAAVLQDDVLFSGTIKDNISFFDKNPDFEHISNCAKLAGILGEIENFPMGFGTLIGDMGSVLSGGQKQRILLARALYARPKILFLDEASSHLDAKKEREVNDFIRSLGITVISIAHRQETIQMADRVIDISQIKLFSTRVGMNLGGSLSTNQGRVHT
jgi:ATP-binding cassette subfamily B protein RaxB